MEYRDIMSDEEGVWFILNKIELTKEEMDLIKNQDSDNEHKKELLERIKLNKKTPAIQEDSDLAQSIYLENKPELKEGDKYRLLSASITLRDNKLVGGLINCRINGNHNQIRF